MSKEGQRPGDDASRTPGNFTGSSVAVRKAKSAFGKSGQPNNQSTERGKGKA